MSKVRRQAGYSDGMGRGWGWLRSNRARQRDHELEGAEQIAALRWQWRKACEVSPVGRMIYTPSGVTVTIPIIAHIDLGPPITLRVQMRPGQTIAGLVAAAPSIAASMNVAGLHVAPLTPPWARVTVLMD